MEGFDNERIERFFSGKYSDEDESYVNEVFCDNNKEERLKNLLERQFNELLTEDDTDQKNLDHILYRIHYDINTRSASLNIRLSKSIIKWTLGIAAVLFFHL